MWTWLFMFFNDQVLGKHKYSIYQMTSISSAFVQMPSSKILKPSLIMEYCILSNISCTQKARHLNHGSLVWMGRAYIFLLLFTSRRPYVNSTKTFNCKDLLLIIKTVPKFTNEPNWYDGSTCKWKGKPLNLIVSFCF